MNTDFKNECEEWLKTLDYFLINHSGDYKSYTFASAKLGENYPNITCNNYEGNKNCSLSIIIPGSWFSIESGEMQFKHPDIKKYINRMKNYIDIIEQN